VTEPTDQDRFASGLAQFVRAALLRKYGGGASDGETLTALLDGGTIHEEWGARYHHPDGGDVDTWRDTRDEAVRTIAARYQGVAPWPHPSSLIRRFVIVTAGQPVEEDPVVTIEVDPDPIILEHLRHMTDGRWHDDCRYCRRRRVEGGTGVPAAEYADRDTKGPGRDRL
jgi:hypothetical protein